MCLIVKQNWFRSLFRMKPRIRTAKKDIVVYKLLAEDRVHDELASYYYTNFHWSIGKVYSSPLVVEKDKYYYFVEKGFHSFLSKPSHDHILFYFPPLHPFFQALYKAIIPKGSKYIIGEKDEVVSDHLKIVERC